MYKNLSGSAHKSRRREPRFRGQQSRFNQLGGVYINGRPLPTHLRHKIIELASEGTRPCAISRILRVSHGCVSKILNRYEETGSILPGAVVSIYKPQALLRSTSLGQEHDVYKQIYKLIQENPEITSQDLRKSLVQEKFCTQRNAPSLAVLNSIICQQNPRIQETEPPQKMEENGINDSNSNETSPSGKNASDQLIPQQPQDKRNKKTKKEETKAGSSSAKATSTGMKRKSFCLYKSPHLNQVRHFLNGFGAVQEGNEVPQRAQYQPKRITRRRNASVLSSEGSESTVSTDFGPVGAFEFRRRRGRTQFTGAQLEVLERAFDLTQYPDLKVRQSIARQHCMTEQRVSVWFSNRRARLRKVLQRAIDFGEYGRKVDGIPTKSFPSSNKCSPCRRSLDRLLGMYRARFPKKPLKIEVEDPHSTGKTDGVPTSTESESNISLRSLLMISDQGSRPATWSAQGTHFDKMAPAAVDKSEREILSAIALAQAYAEKDDPDDYKYTSVGSSGSYYSEEADDEWSAPLEDNSHESITLTSLLRGSSGIQQSTALTPDTGLNASTTAGINFVTTSGLSGEVSPSSIPMNLEMGQAGVRASAALFYQQTGAVGFGGVSNAAFDSQELIPEQYCSTLLRTGPHGALDNVDTQKGPDVGADGHNSWNTQSVIKSVAAQIGPPPPYYYPHQIQASGGHYQNQQFVTIAGDASGQLYRAASVGQSYEYNAVPGPIVSEGAAALAIAREQYFEQNYNNANWN